MNGALTRFIRSLALVALLLAVGMPVATVRAEPCPDCPAGCIPRELAERTVDVPWERAGRCPEGCIPLSSLRELKEEPVCDIVPPELPPARQMGTRQRNIFTQTALGLDPGKWNITGYGAAFWDIAYGVHEKVQIGAATQLPVIFVGLFPNIKVHTALIEDRLYISGAGFGGMVVSYANLLMERGDFLWMAGGTANLSLVEKEHTFTLGLTAGTKGFYHRNVYEGDGNYGGPEYDTDDGAWLFPQVAYRYGFHPDWSFQAEFVPVLFAGQNSNNDAGDVVWIVNYGFRVHGELLFGDFGFMLPFHETFVKDIWKYAPLGFPYFTLGFSF